MNSGRPIDEETGKAIGAKISVSAKFPKGLDGKKVAVLSCDWMKVSEVDAGAVIAGALVSACRKLDAEQIGELSESLRDLAVAAESIAGKDGEEKIAQFLALLAPFTS